MQRSAEKPLRPTWADIDLGAFSENVATVRRLLPETSQLVAVLKADGYGHGAVELARRCEREAAMIATALLEEALELRRARIEVPVIVLGPMSGEQLALAADHRIIPGITGPEELAAACEVARSREITVHLKLDSGMGRMGVTAGELPEAVEMIRSAPRLHIGGIYTHFASADDPSDPFTERQMANFDAMLATLRERGVEAPLHHFANSAATLRRLVRPGDFARVGIALYGSPAGETGAGVLRPVMRWRSEIARLKTLPTGHPVGYGGTFRTVRESRIATIPVGYADGYNRLLSNRGEVLVHERRVPVVGRVSMDLITIDVTDLPDVHTGDEIVLLGDQGPERITADEIASQIGTISYEVFCSVSARVPRVYRDGASPNVPAAVLE